MKSKNRGSYIGFGLAIGVAIGAGMDNVGLGLALGVVFGAALDASNRNKAAEDHAANSSAIAPPPIDQEVDRAAGTRNRTAEPRD